jgi:CO/xanthine dehydrogenase Mo-binding subunit
VSVELAVAEVRQDGALGALGTSAPRKEDHALLTGSARFVDDLDRPGALHAFVLRSPFAHARLVSIETGAALAQPGVHAVFTAADLPEDTPPIPIRLFSRPGMERFLQPPLALDVVRYSGEPVAVVVADSRYLAEDAAELVDVEYEPLTPIVEADLALYPDVPPLHPEAGTNLAGSLVIESGDVEAAFAAADVVVEERFECNRHAAVPLEPRGLVAEVDPVTGVLTVFGAAKVPHVNRRILASLLGLREERVRLVEVSVGGGFGARGEFYPEDFVIPFCATRIGRPVSWIEDREEHLRACNHSREQIHDVAVALDSRGALLGFRDRIVSDTGAYVRTQGMLVPAMTAGLFPGPYAWPAFRIEVRHVVTNKTPAGACRAPGRYEANFVRERVIDVAAHRLGIDPAELRRRNLLSPSAMPHATGSHTDGHPVVYDSGDYPLLFEKGLARFDYERMRSWRNEGTGSRRRGIGVAAFVEKSGVARWEYARVELTSEGRTHVYSGAAAVGQGLDTVLAQVCVDALGVAYDDIAVFHGDTQTVPDGMGTYGSRAASLAGSAVHVAARRLRSRLLELAASVLEVASEELEMAGDRVVARGARTDSISLVELHRLAPRPPGMSAEAKLSEEERFVAEEQGYPYGLQCAAVEIDLATGGVRIGPYTVAYDAGRVLNPSAAESQIVGGVAQGIGGALLEELTYDEYGQPTSSSFADYLQPTAVEIPSVDVLLTEDAPTTTNPLGAKGVGEAGTAAAAAALANAVSDALGAEVTKLPLTPERILELVAKGGAPR